MMMYSLKSGARIDCFGLACSLLTAVVAFVFVGMFYDDPKQSTEGVMFRAVLISGMLGLAYGYYMKYRSRLSSLYTVGMEAYVVVAMGILFTGSVAGLALTIAGRPDLRWFAFNNNVACIILSLLIGMLLEAKSLGLLKGENRWREEIGKYLDYKKRLVDPAITSDTFNSNPIPNPYLIIGAGIGTIPVLFQIFTGDRNNGIFFAAPLGMAAYSYINIKIIGPGLVRILLLLKIEKEQGFRFLNTEFEEIRRMRHDFAFASILMKDYDHAICMANRKERIAMKKRMELQQKKMDAHELRQKNKGKR